jgi:hypothetical protein
MSAKISFTIDSSLGLFHTFGIMLVKRQIIWLIIILSPFLAKSQFSGGAPEGFGGAGLGATDIWAAIYNQAGLADIKGISGGVFYRNQFLVQELGEGGGAVAVPLGSNVVALSFKTFGYSLYQEGKYGISFARYLGSKFRAGVQINYHTYVIGEGYGRQNLFTVEGGFQFGISTKISLNGHIYNPGRARLNSFENERVPTILRGGFVYRYSEKVAFHAEIQKILEYRPSVRCGIEYLPGEKVALRAGISTGSVKAHFGFGLKLNSVNIDVSATYHNILGYSPQLALSYHGE